jgi:hypothetical protein
MIQQRVTTPVPTNHVLHLLLTLLTCGLWLFVWLPVWAINSMRSREIVQWTMTEHTPTRPVGAYGRNFPTMPCPDRACQKSHAWYPVSPEFWGGSAFTCPGPPFVQGGG